MKGRRGGKGGRTIGVYVCIRTFIYVNAYVCEMHVSCMCAREKYTCTTKGRKEQGRGREDKAVA